MNLALTHAWPGPPGLLAERIRKGTSMFFELRKRLKRKR
jgi:hypothetical protein